jgi:non-specific serine/threonine protein kinase
LTAQLTLAPGGHVRLQPGEGTPTPWVRRVAAAFAADPAEGLFTLAAAGVEPSLHPSFSFWRDLAGRYLTALCRTPGEIGDELAPVALPTPAETATLLLGAPPMEGGEYLCAETVEAVWCDLDRWIRDTVATSGAGLSDWLREHAPLWHQVGRVCLHLAENKRDPEYPFAFLATYAPSLSRAGRVQYQPLSKALEEYAGKRNKGALIRLLSPVHQAAQDSGLIQDLMETGDLFHPLAWTPAEAYEFLREVPLLEARGILVRLPDWWRKRPRPRVGVRVETRKTSAVGMDGLLDFRVHLALGDQTLTEEEWQRLLSSEDGLVLLKGQWVEVDQQRLAEALEHWKRVEAEVAEGGGISFAEGMRLLAGAPADLDAGAEDTEIDREWAFVDAGEHLADLLAGLRDPARLQAVRPGRSLKGTLRPYQERGLAWLHLITRLGLGACLADDMGLGKTIQVLALLLVLKQEDRPVPKPSILVLPASLLANWRSEIARFAPSLRARFVHPAEADPALLAAMAANPAEYLADMDVVLTTYGMLLRQPWLREVDWRLAILDEAQAIKNPGTRQSRAVKALKSETRIALTGTPVENRLSDLWSLFDFLCPGLLGNAKRFKGFVKALEKRERERYTPLRSLVAPYILRRLKTDRRVITDLPDKTEVKAFCGLAKPQAALYARAVDELKSALEQTPTGIGRRGLVLSFLMRFKQICNHPSQFLGDGRYAAADSGKFDRLRDLCEEIASRQEKALVFTQFREMTEPLAAFLAEVFGREGLVLHGGTAVKKRQTLVDAFQREEGPPFFVVSLKAGGTGLNLTAASHVIHFDRWWNPAVENQATDRAFRIGQLRNVLVHKFVCRGTVEEKIDTLIEEKVSLAQALLEGGTETLLTEMSDQALVELVSLDIERAQV